MPIPLVLSMPHGLPACHNLSPSDYLTPKNNPTVKNKTHLDRQRGRSSPILSGSYKLILKSESFSRSHFKIQIPIRKVFTERQTKQSPKDGCRKVRKGCRWEKGRREEEGCDEIRQSRASISSGSNRPFHETWSLFSAYGRRCSHLHGCRP